MKKNKTEDCGQKSGRTNQVVEYILFLKTIKNLFENKYSSYDHSIFLSPANINRLYRKKVNSKQ